MKNFLLPIVAAACSLAAQAALADSTAIDARSARVTYADLDLTTSNGAAALYGRIRAAARLVCGPAAMSRALQRYDVWQSCQARATADAVAQLDLPNLTALYRAKLRASPMLAQSASSKRQ